MAADVTVLNFSFRASCVRGDGTDDPNAGLVDRWRMTGGESSSEMLGGSGGSTKRLQAATEADRAK